MGYSKFLFLITLNNKKFDQNSLNIIGKKKKKKFPKNGNFSSNNISIALKIILLFFLIQMSDKIRSVLNRLIITSPRHALTDGLHEICKNFIVAELFERYYFDAYKSPIRTDLLLPHYLINLHWNRISEGKLHHRKWHLAILS